MFYLCHRITYNIKLTTSLLLTFNSLTYEYNIQLKSIKTGINFSLKFCLCTCYFFFGMSYSQREDFKTLIEKATVMIWKLKCVWQLIMKKVLEYPQSFLKLLLGYEKAAEQGDVKSQTKLGLCYYYRKGVVHSLMKRQLIGFRKQLNRVCWGSIEIRCVLSQRARE